MGMYQDLQDDLSDAFDNELSDAVKTVTFIDRKSSTYDPSTGTVGDVENTYPSRGVVSSYTQLEITNSGGKINSNDKKLLVLDVDAPSVDIETNFKVLIAGDTNEYLVEAIRIDAVNAVHRVQLR